MVACSPAGTRERHRLPGGCCRNVTVDSLQGKPLLPEKRNKGDYMENCSLIMEGNWIEIEGFWGGLLNKFVAVKQMIFKHGNNGDLLTFPHPNAST